MDGWMSVDDETTGTRCLTSLRKYAMKESKIFSLFVQFFLRCRRHTLEHPLEPHLCHTFPLGG